MRKERKDQHIEQVLRTEPHGGTLLDNVILEPLSFPEMALSEVDSSVEFLGRRIPAPLLINAMTGGTSKTRAINEDLAIIARTLHLPMQVGSQVIALEDPSTEDTFRVVRETAGEEALLIANLPADRSLEDAKRAMAMIGAQAIGVHVNPSQELAQEEGDRDFRGRLSNLRDLADALPNQVIVKEIGFGMSRADGRMLREVNAAYIDVSGAGGTNFVEVEDQRSMARDLTEFYTWGIPTAKAIWNLRKECPEKRLIASGGITSATDILHALVLGAEMSAMSGELLRYLLLGSRDYAIEYLSGIIEKLRMGMLLLGCRTVEQLHHLPYTMVGSLSERIQKEEA